MHSKLELIEGVVNGPTGALKLPRGANAGANGQLDDSTAQVHGNGSACSSSWNFATAFAFAMLALASGSTMLFPRWAGPRLVTLSQNPREREMIRIAVGVLAVSYASLLHAALPKYVAYQINGNLPTACASLSFYQINASLTSFGTCTFSGLSYAVILDQYRGFTYFKPPEYEGCQGWGINDQGVAVGTCYLQVRGKYRYDTFTFDTRDSSTIFYPYLATSLPAIPVINSAGLVARTVSIGVGMDDISTMVVRNDSRARQSIRFYPSNYGLIGTIESTINALGASYGGGGIDGLPTRYSISGNNQISAMPLPMPAEALMGKVNALGIDGVQFFGETSLGATYWNRIGVDQYEAIVIGQYGRSARFTAASSTGAAIGQYVNTQTLENKDFLFAAGEIGDIQPLIKPKGPFGSVILTGCTSITKRMEILCQGNFENSSRSFLLVPE